MWLDSNDVVTIRSPTSGTSGRLQNRVSVPPWLLHSDCVYLVPSVFPCSNPCSHCSVVTVSGTREKWLHRHSGSHCAWWVTDRIGVLLCRSRKKNYISIANTFQSFYGKQYLRMRKAPELLIFEMDKNKNTTIKVAQFIRLEHLSNKAGKQHMTT